MFRFLMSPVRVPVFAADVTYDRPKDPAINSTGINVDFLAGEEPTGVGALSGDNSGSTGILNVTVTADANPSGGDIQDLFRIEDIQIVIDPVTFKTRLTCSIIPVLGDASDGTPIPVDVEHPENMDAWQTAAGQARAV